MRRARLSLSPRRISSHRWLRGACAREGSGDRARFHWGGPQLGGGTTMSILDGTNEIVDQWLALAMPNLNHIGMPPQFVHRQALWALRNAAIDQLDGGVLVRQLLDKIIENWHAGPHYRPSDKNWIFRQRLNFDADNENEETRLERAVVRVHARTGSIRSQQRPAFSSQILMRTATSTLHSAR